MPPAIPISASFASPGPLTTQPITATLMSNGISATIFSTWFASPIRSILVLPQVGQETTSMPPLRSPNVFKISFADLISSNGSPVSDTRIVSPMPWCKISPRPIEDLILPLMIVPASVMPTCRGWSVCFAISSCAFTHIITSEDLILMTRLSYPISSIIFTLSNALSTIPSAVTPWYFSTRSFSKEPLLTPTRIGICRSLAASTTACTRSLFPIFPGLIRILSAPCSIAAIAKR